MLKPIKAVLMTLASIVIIPLAAIVMAFCWAVALLAVIVKAIILAFRTPIHATTDAN